jgi:hypothetical protein
MKVETGLIYLQELLISNFIKIRLAVPELKDADGQANTISSIRVQFMHDVTTS